MTSRAWLAVPLPALIALIAFVALVWRERKIEKKEGP